MYNTETSNGQVHDPDALRTVLPDTDPDTPGPGSADDPEAIPGPRGSIPTDTDPDSLPDDSAPDDAVDPDEAVDSDEVVDTDEDGGEYEVPTVVEGTVIDPGTGEDRGVPADPEPVDSAPDDPGGEEDPEDPTDRPKPVAVDAPGKSTRIELPARAAAAEAARHPIIAPWMKQASQRTAVLRWAVQYALHVVAFHAVRIPLYVGRLALRAPYGTYRAVRDTMRWAFDYESKPLRTGASDGGDAATYMQLSHQRNDRVKHRLITLGFVVLPLLIGAVFVWWLLPAGPRLLTFVALVCGLGFVGSPRDKPVIGRAVVKHGLEKVTSEIVVRGLGSLGLTGINQAIAKKEGIHFPTPITRDGPGARVVVDLPPGVTADEVMERRKKLASGLRRPLGSVWPSGDASVHEGRLVLFIGDEDMNKAKQPAWPLAKAGEVDVFKPQPFGTDPRGQWISITLIYISGIIGAVPRMGKTFTLRLWLLIAALDPRTELHTYDLKGTGDLDPFEPIAHRHRAGDEDDDIEYILADFEAVRIEMRRRAKVIRGLPKDVCPDSKVTPELASKRSLGLWPIVIGVDECQILFEHPDHGKRFTEICTDLVKRGPATGITLLLATQRPDAKSIPPGISANAIIRYCLKVQGHTENDMVLGTSAHKQGIRATTFAWADKGIGYYRGEGADATITRSVALDGPAVEKRIAAARAVREARGLLTGYAAGVDADPDQAHTSAKPRFDVLADVVTVFDGEGAEKLWTSVILARLAELHGDVYSGWTAKALADALRPVGLVPGAVWAVDENGKGTNRNGYTAAAVRAAKANRDSGQPGDDPDE
ncbi:hypothetical protein [Sciscionella marina]|uniref:hypothetical protein n=1 Tax=Sciscionella marina TaxID=508770 RepID=UPI00036E4D6E|nr:hypothetical protein [Sciscionella marina]